MTDTLDIDVAADFATPRVGWIVAGAVTAALDAMGRTWRPGREPHSLAERARLLRLDVASIRRGQTVVRVADLARLFGPGELAAAAALIEERQSEEVDLQTARDLIGLARLQDAELVAVLERRGIPVSWASGRPRASLGGCCWLARILRAEAPMRPGQGDDFPCEAVLPLLRAAVPRWVGDEPTAEEELDERCRPFDIRVGRTTVDDGYQTRRAATASGYDLYRLLGVAVPGADVEGYRARLRTAYESVLGNPAAPSGEAEPSAGSAPEPAPERIIKRGGRKIVVEEGAVSPVAFA